MISQVFYCSNPRCDFSVKGSSNSELLVQYCSRCGKVMIFKPKEQQAIIEKETITEEKR